MVNSFECPIMATIAMISDKWKVLILCKLRNGKLRFNELKRALQGVTQRVLTHQLRELEADGLIKRTIYAEVPPRVEYELTNLGTTLMPALASLETWAQDHWEELAAKRTQPAKAREQESLTLVRNNNMNGDSVLREEHQSIVVPA